MKKKDKLKLNTPTRPKLLVLILSGINYTSRRTIQRKTWLRDLDEIPYLFLMGNSDLNEKNSIYVNAPDNKLPEKLYQGYKKCLDLDFDYLFTCDDDTYVVVERLLTSGYSNHDYMGTSYTFNGGDRKGLTHAEGGAGFFLSRTAVKNMLLYPIDGPLVQSAIASDTMVGDLATWAKIPLHHHNDFNQGWSMEKRPGQIPSPTNSAITSHYMNEEQFRETYKAFHPRSMFLV